MSGAQILDRDDSTTIRTYDAQRGRRRVGYDSDGTPAWIERADGSRIDIERDDNRRRIQLSDASGPILSLAVRDGRVVASDSDGRTSVRRSGHSVRVARETAENTEADVLRIDRDEDHRPRRVTLPGSTDDLFYRPDGAGRWLVGPADGPVLLEIEERRGTTTVRGPGGWGWHETPTRERVSLTTLDGEQVATTELDSSGRIVGRSFADGSTHHYERDDRQRLARWVVEGANSSTTEWLYRDDDLIGVVTDGRRQRHRLDDAGRLTALIGHGTSIRYRYGANGSRVERRQGDEVTRYRYDALGQLVQIVAPDGARTSLGWDGLGRRTWIDHGGRRLHEHRGVDGRLWSVTDDLGRAVHTFVWWRGRVIARIDGPVGSDVVEAYVTDPLGTLVAVVTPEGLERILDDPRGVCPEDTYRPTMYGHIADGRTGLIPFGARDYDPESGYFLTPDPWHGGPDDPRVVAGARPDRLAMSQESPVSGVHAYALGQFDPVSRPDLDGHVAVGNILLSIILAPTWGFPLTSLSLFFFLPVNIYFELIGLLIYIFCDHPWPQHSIVNMKFLAGSSQLGTAGFALNGFLPRVIAGGGVDADRAVTIGHVAWENRRYFELLDRPRVLTVQNIAGPPDANGRPSGGPTAFSDTARGSIVVVEGTDDDGRLWIHGSWWTRGGGSHVGTRGSDLAFEDHVPPGTAHSTGTLLLAQPLPESMTTPQEADDDGVLKVTEYDATLTSTGEILRDQWFAIGVDEDAGFAVGDALKIEADDDTTDPVYAAVHRVLEAEHPILILDHELPTRFQTSDVQEDGVDLTELQLATGTAAGTSAGWVRTNPVGRGLRHASPGHTLRVGSLLKIDPTPTKPSPERPLVYGEIETLQLVMTFDVGLPGGLPGATVSLLVPDGDVARGTVPNPAATPADVEITGDHDFEVGDVVAVQGSGPDPHHASITAISGATPSVITLDPPIPGSVVSAAGTAVGLARLEPSTEESETGTVSAETPGTNLRVDARSNTVFVPSTPVQVEQGGTVHVRTIASLTNTIVVLVEQMAGILLGPDFEVTVMSLVDDSESGEIATHRFVLHTGGDAPAAYGNWPNAIMGLAPTSYFPVRRPLGWRFFVNPTTPIRDLHTDFDDFWEPLALAGNDYWLLRSKLKIVEDDGDHFWEPDPDDTFPRRHRQILQSPPTAWEVRIRQFERAVTPVVRPFTGGDPVLCRPAETQVPDEPKVRWSLADALDEHELAHTLQNTYWGPLLGALPLQGLFRAVPETMAAAGREPPEWMLWNPFDEAGDGVGFDDTNIFELLSMAGLMQLAWTFIILGPALGDDNARRFLLGLNFSDWGRVFNPVNQLVLNEIPEIDPEADADERWGLWTAHLFTKAFDMRSWTPLIGLVPLLLPDAATNFIEQQASRWTGDLYSTILTVDDLSNRDSRLRLGSALLAESRDADRTVPLGSAARIMIFHATPLGRFLEFDQCDTPTRLVHLEFSRAHDFVEIELTTAPTGSPALLPSTLYERSGAPTVQIDGPDLPDPTNPGSTIRSQFEFIEVTASQTVDPTLRAVVPVAPAVVRAAGFYLLAASEGEYQITAHESDAGSGDTDPHTYHATVTIGGKVTVDEVVVPWTRPLLTGVAGPPPAPTSDDISRFETEVVPMVVTDQDTTDWVAEGDGGVFLDLVTGGNGWEVRFADPGTGLPTRARIRIWRPVRPHDPEVFDFEHEGEPTREGIRSYLEEEIWIPIRDFSVEVAPLPTLGAATFDAADEHELALPVEVAGPSSISVTPAGGRTLDFERAGDDPPRGERWSFELSGRKAVEATLTFPVRVTFGTAPNTVDRNVDLTVDPNFTIDTSTAGGPYVVSEAGGPLELEIAGGSAPFSIDSDLPDGVTGEISGRTITLTATDEARAGRQMLVIEDDDGALGVRDIRIEL